MDSKLLQKYFQGKCAAHEAKQVLEWFKRGLSDPEVSEDLQRFWLQAEATELDPKQQPDPEVLFAKISATLSSAAPPATAFTEPGGKSITLYPGRWRQLAKVAAAVILPVLLSVLYLLSTKTGETGREVVIKSPVEQSLKTTLPDGTIITLNVRSQLTYHFPFNRKRREVKLEGEAFFEVAPDKARPFIVRSGKIATQALGTSFNINHRPNDTETRVALVTGQVKINRDSKTIPGQGVLLMPGQQLTFSEQNQDFKIRAFQAKEVLGWRKGLLYFNKASLHQVTTKLENWFGVDITISQPIPAQHQHWQFTGEYDNPTLENVLAGIAFVKDFTFRKQGDQVKINLK